MILIFCNCYDSQSLYLPYSLSLPIFDACCRQTINDLTNSVSWTLINDLCRYKENMHVIDCCGCSFWLESIITRQCSGANCYCYGSFYWLTNLHKTFLILFIPLSRYIDIYNEYLTLIMRVDKNTSTQYVQ